MFSIDNYSRVPIYQQIIDGIRRDISLGLMQSGEQAPSIRQLSVELGANPNTVSKAYAELERTGILSAAIGKGYFVSADALQRIRESTIAQQEEAFASVAEKLAIAGVSEEVLLQKLHQIYQAITDKED